MLSCTCYLIYSNHSIPRAPVTLAISATSTLLFLPPRQPKQNEPLAHSLQNIGGIPLSSHFGTRSRRPEPNQTGAAAPTYRPKSRPFPQRTSPSQSPTQASVRTTAAAATRSSDPSTPWPQDLPAASPPQWQG